MSFQLTLGPLLFNWANEKRRDFYYQMAEEAPIDIVYLGEVVCFKRLNVWEKEIPRLIECLQKNGKTVVFSTLALLQSKKEMNHLFELVSHYQNLLIEINDIAYLNLLTDKSFSIGPYVNVYNELALAFLANRKAKRLVFNYELNKQSIAALAGSHLLNEYEIQVFGRLPLAISARCAHARVYKRSKNNCEFVCDKDQNGLEVFTLDQQPFLTVNGLQTMSYTVCNLIAEIPTLKKMGVHYFRLSAQVTNMATVAQLFHAVIDEKISAHEGMQKLRELLPNAIFSDGFYQQKAGCCEVV